MFRVLSLDGGGIRGAFAAAFLAELERRVDGPIGGYFDLIAGTSTGGIIATALALGEPAARIEAMYVEHGAAIFTRPRAAAPWWSRVVSLALRRRWPAIDPDWIFGAKYQSDTLTAVLSEVFGVRTLEAATTARLVVPAVDLAKGQTIVFKTPHLPGMVRDRHIRAVDVVLSTTAAPTYFRPAVIGPGSAYCDGGLWANNPAVVAYAEACKIADACCRPGVDLPFERKDVRMLSIGTGTHPYFVPTPEDGKAGLLFWAPSLLDVLGASQSQGVGFQAQYFLGPDRYTRVDFPVQDRSWALDNVTVLERLIHLGREAARAGWSGYAERFLASRARPYVAFREEE